jgi:uncharacterized protein YkwD
VKRLLLVAALVAVAAACAPRSADPPQQSLPQPSPTAVTFNETARGLLAAVNRERSAGATCAAERFHPASALRLEARLIRTAELHTTDMVKNSFFSHTGSDGSSVSQRVTRQGYEWRAVGENIAYGQRSVEQVVEAWMNSPSHCRAIMDSEFTELGAARVENHWTLVFGTPR